jgi:hypothetical protein
MPAFGVKAITSDAYFSARGRVQPMFARHNGILKLTAELFYKIRG